ncbi:CAF17-like 4Fe-4S cluster assembly/insertion protein YgfZ [Flavimaricola marinus]|uniref:Putative global regulator n=1 Tax=Flavimaricola marinus TaxID=1819565 RepID=A0A238LHT7_9RHOB|nr:folate-binding protein YgfZ [Flavimaricola marinus]SMY08964.1 putative global regulator [Flavimaricola marinus]
MTDRTVLALTGKDRIPFLQGLITNDVSKAEGGIIYAALLTPQGKYIADFFVIGENDRLLIDVATSLAPALAQRLSMYRLRADVQISETDLVVSRGTADAPAGAVADPRHPSLGWRLYGTDDQSDGTDWDALRTAYLVPESGVELTPDTYILEARFDALHGVDFKKGCYVGQEVTARMKHKTELKKGLAKVRVSGRAEPGTEITSDGKPAGILHTVAGDEGIAYLRFDRAEGEMEAGEARLVRLPNPEP